MTSTREDLRSLFQIVPEWQVHFNRLEEVRQSAPVATAVSGTLLRDVLQVLQQIGPKDMYACLLKNQDQRLSLIVRNLYFIPLLEKMFVSNVNLKRFAQDRRLDQESQRSQATSMAVEVAIKLQDALQKNVREKREDGFRVLLPAYAQSTVSNAVIDYIKDECHWERSLLHDSPEEEGDDSPIERLPDESLPGPEQMALSREKVQHLNAFRNRLMTLIEAGGDSDGALTIIDCIFGLGLTPHSKAGVEMTMRECAEKLALPGETQARKIARCQVLLDKGLERIRNAIRENLPGLTECFQTEINVNVASRRDLNHQLGLTEGETERLIQNRQFMAIEELVKRAVVKSDKLQTLIGNGAVAAFVPIDVNSAPSRDLMDILGLDKILAKQVVEKRPFFEITEVSRTLGLHGDGLQVLIRRGAVLRKPKQNTKNNSLPNSS